MPALTSGNRGAHAYEVSPADAAVIAKALGGSFTAADAKQQVFIAILETGDKPQLRGLLLSRADIGQPKIGSATINAKALDGKQIATLLQNAKELPVVGRVTGFSVTELAGTRPTVAQVIGSEKPALPTTTTTTDRTHSPLSTRLQNTAQNTAQATTQTTSAKPVQKPTKRDGEDAARAYTNLLTGWGGDSDVAKVGKFVVNADPDVYAAFAAKVIGKKAAWHPGHIRAAFTENASLKQFAPAMAALLATVPEAPAGLDPARTGTDLKNFATGWYTADEISRLVSDLPGVLADPFAFAAVIENARHSVDVDKGAEAARAAVKKVATREMASRSPAEQKLLQQLIDAL